jgi:uncharacterized protein YyaL (SSP411 family)
MIGWLLACGVEAPAPAVAADLAQASSPYLRQHASDAVRWREWGDAAFEEARAHDRLVLVLVGYAACHWCHTLQVESLGDPTLAAALEADFVPVIVDREEHPDVDWAFVALAQQWIGHAGWPLLVVLTAERQPVFVTGYLPRQDGERGFSRGIGSVLGEVGRRWRSDRDAWLAEAPPASARIDPIRAPTGLPDLDAVAAGRARLRARFDPVHAGFGDGPRFPRPWNLSLLAAEGGEAYGRTLDAIASGGLSDPISGGFFRYTTDAAWRSPHLEKMLVDQAALAMVFLEARRDDVVRDTLAFTVSQLRLPSGAFASSLSAAPAYYLWTVDQAPAGEGLLAGLDQTPRVPTAPAGVRLSAAWAAIRARRPPPERIDSVVTAWNGLMVSALAQAGFAWDEPAWVSAAVAAADAVLGGARRADGTLSRTPGGPPGWLDDQACWVAALLDLFVATGEVRWLDEARALHRASERTFASSPAGWQRTGPDHYAPWGPVSAWEDGPEPAALAVTVRNGLRIAAFDADTTQAERAVDALRPAAGALRAGSTAHAGLLLALDAALRPGPTVVITGEPGDIAPLRSVVRHARLRDPAVVWGDPAVAAVSRDKPVVAGVGLAYVCWGTRCAAPTSDPATLAALLSEVSRPPDRGAGP